MSLARRSSNWLRMVGTSVSYAKARILTRYADEENEQQLLDLAVERTGHTITTELDLRCAPATKHAAD